MSYDIPTDRRYLDSHEWVSADDDGYHVGISDFAQDELGDVVYIELPAVGDTFEQGEVFGVIESIKAISDIYAPVAGTVTEINEELLDRPELINDAPYDDGWMIVLDPEDSADIDDLLDADAYRNQIE